MAGFKIFLCIIGRICISVIFIASGINKCLEWNETTGGVDKALSEWVQRSIDNEDFQSVFTQLLPYVDLLVICAIVLELGGGLMVLLGFKARLGGFLLFLFMIPTTLLFHSYWFYEDNVQQMQLVMFLKNLAIMGGLLYVIAFGSGKGSKVKVVGQKQ